MIISLPEKTKEQQIDEAKNRLQTAINILFEQMKGTYLSNYDLVWNSSYYSPQEIMDAFGMDGVELFRLSGLLATIIETAKPGTLDANYLSAKLPYTPNPDGTITIEEN